MYYPESEAIASEHPELTELIRSVDRYLRDLGDRPARPEPLADLLHADPGAIKQLLRVYLRHGTVERVEISLCPTDGEILEKNEQGLLECDVCEAVYQPDDCETEIAYRVRSPLGTAASPVVEHTDARTQIFLSYAREDTAQVEDLYDKLSGIGWKPWMASRDILPGEKWENSIKRAIQTADFFLACLTRHSVNKRGWVQRETKHALDLWQEKLEDDIYLIPVRLENCQVPQDLSAFQWVDLFEQDGWDRLVRAIQVGTENRLEDISAN